MKAGAAVDNALNSPEHRDIIGAAKVGKSALGTGKFTSFCSSTNKQKKNTVIKETIKGLCTSSAVEPSRAMSQMGRKSGRVKVELERALTGEGSDRGNLFA